MSESGIAVERQGEVATIWLDRPEANNALNMPVITNLGHALREADEDRRVKVVVLRGRGRTFCAGFDLSIIGEFAKAVRTSLALHDGFAAVGNQIEHMGKAVVAVVHGHIVAGGFELMMACDLTIAVDGAKIGDFHAVRGLVAGDGPSYRLPRIVGMRRAKELILTGRLLSASEALDWGLVNLVAPPDKVEEVLGGLLAQLTNKAPITTHLAKAGVLCAFEASTTAMQTIDKAMLATIFQTADTKEGIQSFLDKREPNFTGD